MFLINLQKIQFSTIHDKPYHNEKKYLCPIIVTSIMWNSYVNVISVMRQKL